MSLKSISPFIASILLIGFTVSTGIIIYYFLTTFPRTQMQEISGLSSKVLSCAGATFELKVKGCNLLDGLVLWLPMDEGSGNITYDYSPYKNNGTLYNGTTWVDGKIGKALSFDGVDDYVEIGKAFNLLSHTVMAWIRIDSTISSSAVLFWNEFGDDYWMRINHGGKLFAVYSSRWTSPGYHFSNAPPAPYFEKWVHISETWDGSRIRFYVNGTLDREISNTYIGTGYFFDNPRTRIGFSYTGHPLFKGIVDEVLIYTRALSEEEIKKLYYHGLENKFNITIGLLNDGYADLGKSFIAIVYLKNGTILQFPLILEDSLKRGSYLEKTITVDGYYPSYGLVDKLIVCSNDCQGVCSEVIVNNQC